MNLFKAAVNAGYKWIWFMKTDREVSIIHLYTHFCGYCISFVWICASVRYSIICLYCNNIEKSYREKRRIRFGMWSCIDQDWSAECLETFSENILGTFDVVLKSGFGERDCNALTIKGFEPKGFNKILKSWNIWKIRIRKLNSWRIYDYSLEPSRKWTL